jgi:D-3-phosphoglycerate dehydrogenase
MIKRILITCPPVIGILPNIIDTYKYRGIELFAPKFQQTLSEQELVELVPGFDGWIIGDELVTEKILKAGKNGRIKAAVKWGVGTDNIDFDMFAKFDIPIANTPGMFGDEVADLAIGYVVALARETFSIHDGIINGSWPKPCGVSLAHKKVALIGYGDIGKNVAKRLVASNMFVEVYDPAMGEYINTDSIHLNTWPNNIEEVDFIIITSSLNESTFHMLNSDFFKILKDGVRLVNVGRGKIIDEKALEVAMEVGKVHSAALDVFEEEPLPMYSGLRKYKKCIFGSHNASNTIEAVNRTTEVAFLKLLSFLNR